MKNTSFSALYWGKFIMAALIVKYQLTYTPIMSRLWRAKNQLILAMPM